jgi:Ni,Fe-hydrogenase I cytochrome b subunit
VLTSEKKQGHSSDRKAPLHIAWGVILVLAGIGVFIRIPQVMPKIEEIEFFSAVIIWVRFCFYLLGVLLIGGGLKKVYENYCKITTPNKPDE